MLSAPSATAGCCPAGPLREPLTALQEADVLILSRYDQNKHQDRLHFLRRLFPLQAIFTASIEPTVARCFPGGEEHPPEALRGLAALAFAGLARPRVFRDTLTALGVDLRSLRAFPDHHAFTPGDLAGLLQAARAQGLRPWSPPPRIGPAWARSGRKICLSGS